MKTKRTIGLTLAIMLVASIFTVLSVGAYGGGATPEAQDNPRNIDVDALASLRVYGECDEGPVARAGLGSDRSQFVYPNYYDPFDPSSLLKDSVTFNPALIREGNNYWGVTMAASSINAYEKVFLRLWYEPEHLYTNSYEYPTIEVETTYMLTRASNCTPISGTGNRNTWFVFPITEKNVTPPLPGPITDQTGLADIENILASPDRSHVVFLKNVSSEPIGDWNKTTKGTIQIEQGYEFTPNEIVQFLDHKLQFVSIVNRGGQLFAKVNVWYAGNLDDDSRTRVLLGQFDDGTSWEDPLAVTWFKRHNERYSTSSHTWPEVRTWYAKYTGGQQITVGKELQAGDTFYVNAVRYDVPAIEVIDTDGIGTNGAEAFKYITLRTPLPKAKSSLLVPDDGKASSQWIDTIEPEEQIPLLPPFNFPHDMARDINEAPKTDCPLYYPDVEPLTINYIEESIDRRFSTNLLEVLNETLFQDKEPAEDWFEFDIRTRPDQYTEFVLPMNRTDAGDVSPNRWYYLLTTSFLAPNSIGESDLGVWQGRGTIPRAAFVHDAVNAKDIYVNFNDSLLTVRLYGEDNTGPFNGYQECGNYYYENYQYPFNPAAIRKDSITFNPAIVSDMDEFYGEATHMSANSNDIDVKKYLRMWYEPEHNYSPPFVRETIMAETTYVLIDSITKLPRGGSAEGGTYFVFPIVANFSTAQKGLDEFENAGARPDRDNVVTLAYVNGTVSAFNKTVYNNATMRIEKEYRLYPSESVEFLTHRLTVNPLGGTFTIDYIGNPWPDVAFRTANNVPLTTANTWFDAHLNPSSGPTHPEPIWYARLVSTYMDSSVDIVVGTELMAGDTFYVDGIRYDVAAIEVYDTGNDTYADHFKSITLSTPLPKCWGTQGILEDDGCISSQYIWCWPPNTPLPINPPFNMEHYLVDDIDVPLWESTLHCDLWPLGDLNGIPGSTYFPCGERYVTMLDPCQATLCGAGDGSAWCTYFGAKKVDTNTADEHNQGWIAEDVQERTIPDPYDPLVVQWVDETYEPRYSTHLAEVLNETITGTAYPSEFWARLNINTRPDEYTEILLPGDRDHFNFSTRTWNTRLHNDYLVTTSFLAPNAVNSTLADLTYTDYKRAAFVYDAIDIKGIYVNKYPVLLPPGPNNTPPNITAVNVTPLTVEGCEEVNISTAGTTEEHWPLTIWVNWGDGTPQSEPQSMGGLADTRYFTHRYTKAGVYNIAVHAEDIYGFAAVNTSNWVTVNTSCATLVIKKGWNAIAFPVTPIDDFATIFSFGWYTGAKRWDVAAENWASVPGTDIPDPAKGYFIYKGDPGDLVITVTGTAAGAITPSITPGKWNLVGVGDTAYGLSPYWGWWWDPVAQAYQAPTTTWLPTRAYFTGK